MPPDPPPGRSALPQRGHDAEQQLALRGGGVRPLVVADEVDAQALKLGERVDQLAQGAGEAVVAPDQEHVELPAAGGLEHGAVLGAIVAGAARVVDVLAFDREAPALGILAQLPELRLRVLPPVDRRYPRVDGGALHALIIPRERFQTMNA
jgi:hypothetical protein